MLRYLEPLVPKFLKRWDRQLLLNYPVIWATRIHMVLFFSTVALGLLGIHLLTRPLSTASVPEVYAVYGLLFIPCIIATAVWGLSVYQRRPELHFGQYSLRQEVMVHGLYLAALIMIFVLPLAYFGGLQWRISRVVTTAQYIEDMRLLNEAAVYTGKYDPETDSQPDGEAMPFSEVIFFAENPGYYEQLYNNRYARYETLNKEKAMRQAEAERALLKAIRARSEAEHVQRIELLQDCMQRYAGATALSSAEIFTNFRNQQAYLNNDILENQDSWRRIHQNTGLIEDARNFFSRELSPKRAMSGINALIFAALLVLFAYLVFMKSGLKAFLLSLVTFVAGTMALAFTEMMLRDFLPTDDDLRIPLYFTAALLGMGALAFRQRGSLLIRQIALTLTSALTPMALTGWMIWYSDQYDVWVKGNTLGATGLISGIFVAVYLCWHVLYSPQFRRLAASPANS